VTVETEAERPVIGLGDVRADEDLPALAPLANLSSRSGLVAEAIRDAILRGHFAPGTTLVERKLASMLGVSKTPVREALIGLARDGLVTMSPNRGVSVRVIDAAELRSIYEVRLRLEPWAVGRAVASFSADAVEEARSVLGEARAAVESDDRASLTLINRRFHRLLYSRCGNDMVASILNDLQDQVALGVVSVLWREVPTWSQELTEHEAILDAVALQDASRAETLMSQHIERCLHNLEGL
jgi:DNA-binding GntR family transcriptional regulator